MQLLSPRSDSWVATAEATELSSEGTGSIRLRLDRLILIGGRSSSDDSGTSTGIMALLEALAKRDLSYRKRRV